MEASTLTTIAMILYMAMIIGIGLYYAKRSNQSSDAYFLGGRSLGPWVTAMSAEASDMSGWLLMGVPGLAYWTGLADALWTAIGLGIGTYINWLIVAKRLRVYSHEAGDSITLPDFFSRRFCEKKPVIMTISAIFILIFFTVYSSSCFVTVGKLFSNLFNINYVPAMILGAAFVVTYTFIGGFLAESVSDFIQSIVMIFALVFVVSLGLKASGGWGNVVDTVKAIPGFFESRWTANPSLQGDQQIIENGRPLFSSREAYSNLQIISTLSWGLGYFGVPQVLLRFMAIRDPKEIKTSRRIATVWVFISLLSAVTIGIIGRALYPMSLTSQAESENIFVIMTRNLLPPFAAGLILSGILAATISSADSYLLIASSAFSKNIFQGLLMREADDRDVMRVSRISMIVISVIAVFLALDENSVIFNIVSFAWSGFGAVFGPLVLCSLFSKRVTREGAVAGMVSGGLAVFIWRLGLSHLGGIFEVYELLPAFLISLIAILIVSSFTKNPIEVEDQHDRYLERIKAL